MKLTDTSLFPFGMYKGKPMQDVPVKYLHWFWHNGSANSEAALAVMAYIEESLNALKEEDADLLWRREK